MPSMQDARGVFSGRHDRGQEEQQQQQHRPPRHSPQQHVPPSQASAFLYDSTQHHHSGGGSAVPSDESLSASPPHQQQQRYRHHHVTVTPPHAKTNHHHNERQYPLDTAPSYHTNNTSTSNTHNHHIPHAHSHHSWDSDPQFPLAEIQRIKNKTKKLRKGHEQAIFRSSSNQQDSDNGEQQYVPAQSPPHPCNGNEEEEDDDDGFRHGNGMAPFSPRPPPEQHHEGDEEEVGEIPASATGTRSFYSDNTGGVMLDVQRSRPRHGPAVVSGAGGGDEAEHDSSQLYVGPRTFRRMKNPNNNINRSDNNNTPSPPIYRHRSWSSNTSGQQQQQHHNGGGGGFGASRSQDSLADVLDETEEPSESTSSGASSILDSHRGGRGRRRGHSADVVVRRAEQELVESFKKQPAARGRSTSRGRSTTKARTSTSRATEVTSASSATSSRKGQFGTTPPRSIPRHYGDNTNNDNDDDEEHEEYGYETLLHTSTDLDVSNEESVSREAAAAAVMENGVQQQPSYGSTGTAINLALHDLCGEAVSQNDIAWRNALYLLSVQPELARVVMDDSWTALHISCMGQEPPPTFMTRALLYCHGKAAQMPDAGGRYPLHLVAASSGHTETMQLLVQEYPQAICKIDHHGMTPLHLLVRNTAVELTVDNVQVLLPGFTPNSSSSNNHTSRNKNHNNTNNANQHLLQRRGEHLNLRIEELHRLRQSQRQLPQTIFHRYNNAYYEKDHFDKNTPCPVDVDDEFEKEFGQYPNDVQVSLRRIAQGKRHERRQRQVRRHYARKKNQIPIDDDDDHDEAVPLEYDNSDYYYYFQSGGNGSGDGGGGPIRLCETNPAAIPTRQGGLMELPLHMIVRRGLVERTPLAADINACLSSSSSTKRHGSRSKSKSGSADYNDHDCNIEDADIEQGTNGSITMDVTNLSDDDDDNVRVRSSQKAPRPSIPNVFEVIRTVIAAYPPALAFRDAHGLTPLLTVMLSQDSLPSLDVIDLLLGKRSLGYKTIPSWAQDMPLHRFLLEPSSSSSNAILENPAMVPTTDTNQVPLHVAAEELLSDVSLVQTIYEAYPAAIKVQDNRGRTPLHLALNSYRRIPPNPKIISMLLRDSTVAQIRDDDGNLPFDLLVQSANNFPLTMPKSWTQASSLDKYAPPDGVTDTAAVYTKFFHASMLGAARPKNKAEAKNFLGRLRGLPPWLQRQACAASFVQELLVDELSSPWKCAIIFLDGLLLALLVTVFRIQIKEFIDFHEATDVRRSSLYTYLVYSTAASRLVIQGIFCALVGNIGQLRHLVLANGWWWVDYSAMGLSMVTSVLLNGSLSYNNLLTLSTVVTALLWLTVLAYLSHWSYGTAVFMGMLGKIARYMFWPMVTLVVLVICFAQLFFTLLHVDDNCANAMGGTTAPVCTAQDAYRVIYLLLFFNNDALIDASGESQMSFQATMLVTLFVVVLVLVLLGLLVLAVVSALESDVYEIAARSYWEPKMAFVLSSYDVGGFFCCYQRGDQRYSLQHKSCEDRYTMRLASAWDLVMLSLSPTRPSYSAEPTAAAASRVPDRQSKLWYAKTAQAVAASRQEGSFSSLQAILAWPLWMVSIIIVPIWLVLGFLTLGWLWPPQVRRWLFQPNVLSHRGRHGNTSIGGDNVGGAAATMEYTSTQLSDMRTEMNDIKTMSYEQSGNIEREIRELKELLYFAMKEE